MSTLGTIGSGNIGSTVARLALAAGYDVVLSNSRGPDTLSDLVADLGPRARAATAEEAAAAGDLVLVTIPTKAYAEVPVAPLAGKVVLDTMNYYPERDGRIPELADKSLTSSELLQRHLPDARVVKAFNNIYSAHLLNLARPAGAPDRSVLTIAGEPEAQAVVTEFLDRIGYDALDIGPLAESWRVEPDRPAYGRQYLGKVEPFDDEGTPAGADVVAPLVADAGER